MTYTRKVNFCYNNVLLFSMIRHIVYVRCKTLHGEHTSEGTYRRTHFEEHSHYREGVRTHTGSSPMSLILVGQTELWDQKLRLQSYAAIRQRIDMNIVLNRLDRAETGKCMWQTMKWLEE